MKSKFHFCCENKFCFYSRKWIWRRPGDSWRGCFTGIPLLFFYCNRLQHTIALKLWLLRKKITC